MKTRIIKLLLVLFAATPPVASHAEQLPLFDSEDTLDIVLEFPVQTLLRQAKRKPLVDGLLHYVDKDGKEISINMKLTTRGRSRLKHCRFPPLSMALDKKSAATTLFAGQRRLKIATHCRNGQTYTRYLHQEMGIYKTYNLLSTYSFRTRLLNITYRDSQGKRKDEIRPGFIIESQNEVARRNGMKKIETKSVKLGQFHPAQTNILELFQYMIANTDWSIKKGQGDENCCHNAKLIAKKGETVNWVALPYDFDQAGLINTNYALPSPQLKIRTTRQRLYRGHCQYNEYLEQSVKLFNERRADIEKLNTPQVLNERIRKSTLAYLDDFYVIINDPAKMKQHISGACRGAKKQP